ncbi:MAG: hypothetical protein UT94_C0006G0023 [Candidatus Uhrbacteria bacterium GW2011_GWF2_40_263]|nr:MAG: hypothetical protein UT94_C0006G0023 [Candidatus Uhrbacteria bacterium GW2011_GWF2_40_263]
MKEIAPPLKLRIAIFFSVLGEGQRGIKGVNARSPKLLIHYNYSMLTLVERFNLLIKFFFILLFIGEYHQSFRITFRNFIPNSYTSDEIKVILVIV